MHFEFTRTLSVEIDRFVRMLTGVGCPPRVSHDAREVVQSVHDPMQPSWLTIRVSRLRAPTDLQPLRTREMD